MSDETTATDLPSSVGRYQITGALGFGAMGAVYKAFDPLIKRTLAIKTIRLDIPRQSKQYTDFLERFYREARVSGTLSHPNIVTLFDIGEEEGLPFLAMEFVDGVTIASLLDGGTRFKPEKVIGLVSQVAAALDYAHSRGVVHRDIKPSNLIVYEDDKVKVTDFGIAKLSDAEITHSGQLLGTPSYMSPEQAMGEKLDGRSDIFSLGVCAFEMLSGLQPFPGANVTAILYKLVHVDPIEPPDLELNGLVPQKWHDVFHKVLAKKPEDRYPTAGAFVQDLEYCLGAWFSGLGQETIALPALDTAETAVLKKVPAQAEVTRTISLGVPQPAPVAAPATSAPAAEDTAATVMLRGQPAPPAARSRDEAATVILGPQAAGGPIPTPAAGSAETTLQRVALETVVTALASRATSKTPRSGARWVLAGAGFVLLLGAAFAGFVRWRQSPAPVPTDTAPPATISTTLLPPPTTLAAVVTTGSLHVESEPTGARVLVDGALRGTTPLDLAEMAFGSHELRVEQRGFDPQVRTVVLSAEQPTAQTNIVLARTAVPTASAEILSEPAGATVTIDGRPAGRTPLQAAALRPGSRRLDLELEGHVRWSGVLDLVAGQKGRVEVRLQRRPEPVATPTPSVVDLERVYRSDEVDVAPRKVSGTSPSYPSDRGAPRLKSGQKVSVKLRFVVTETGEIRDLTVVESGGALLDEVVVAAVRGWKFQPGMKRGTRVKAETTFKQTFLGG